MLLLVTQFIYNITLQDRLKILLFKANHNYKLKILLSLKQVKKGSEIAKEKVKTFINFNKDFKELVKLV